MNITTVGIELAKKVFSTHGDEARGKNGTDAAARAPGTLAKWSVRA